MPCATSNGIRFKKSAWIRPALRLSRWAGVAFVLLLLLPRMANGQPQSDGAALFKAKCTVCHGADGGGGTAVRKALKMRDLRSAEVQKQSDAELFTITSCGKGKMPAYETKLSDEQIRGLVGYLRGLGKQK